MDIGFEKSGLEFELPTYLPLALDSNIWYNDYMETELITAPDIGANLKRIIADAYGRQADVKVPYDPDGSKKYTKRDILATILWDIAIEGKAFLADGTAIAPESYSDWLATIKYLSTHVDGPVGREDAMGTNVFKVYVGVNVDKV